MFPGNMRNKATWFFAGEFAINAARGLFTLALGMLLYAKTESLWAFAAVFASEFAVGIFLQGIAGTSVDRFGASRVLLTAAGCSVLAIGLPLLAKSGTSDPNILLLAAIGLNVFRPFIRNAIFVLTPDVAGPQGLDRLNSLLSIALQAGQIVGMVMAGVVLEFWHSGEVVFVVLVGHVLAFACYAVLFGRRARVDASSPDRARGNGSWAEVFRQLREDRALVWLLAIAAVDYFSIAAFNLLLAPAVKYNFDDQARWLTIIDVCFAVGAVLGGVWVGRRRIHGRMRVGVSAGTALAAVMVFVAYAMALPAVVVLCATFCFGALATASTVCWMGALQRRSLAHIKGRLASLRYIVNASAVAVGVLAISKAHDLGFTEASAAAAVLCACLFGCAALGMLAGGFADETDSRAAVPAVADTATST